MLRKYRLLFFILSFSLMHLNAQVTQIGVVKELNSQGKPISGVGIEFPANTDLQPTFSDNNGFFKLIFTEKKAGEVIYNLIITKNGYEIVNIYALNEGWTLSPHDTLEIIIAKKGIVAEMRSQYYNLISQYQEQQFQEKTNDLKRKLQENSITNEEYSRKIELLEEELRVLYSKLNEYADKFARINKDDMDSLSKSAFKMLETGNIAGAITIYENSKLLSQLQQKIAQRQESQISINYLIPKLYEEIDCRLLLSGKDNLEKIDTIYQEIILADSANYRFLMDYTIFLTDLQQFQEAIMWNQKALFHAKSTIDSVEALHNLGHINFKIQNFEKSEHFLLAALQEAEKLKEKKPLLYLKANSFPLNTLATLYLEEDRLPEAETYFLKAIEVRKKICQTDSSYFTDYATALNNIGLLYHKINSLNKDSATAIKAIQYLREAIKIRTKLAEINPSLHLYTLANSYNNIASVFWNIGNTDTAFLYYHKANELLQKIVPQNPNMYAEYYVINLFNIGSLYSKLKDFAQAENYYNQATEICNKYLTANPKLHNFHTSNLCNNKGMLYKKMKKYPEARAEHLKALSIRKDLKLSDQSYNNYYIFESLNNLGVLEYICKNYDSANTYFIEAKAILTELNETNPNVYILHYANVTKTIAYIYYLQKNKNKGKIYYKEAIALYKKLNKKYSGKFTETIQEISKEYADLKKFKG